MWANIRKLLAFLCPCPANTVKTLHALRPVHAGPFTKEPGEALSLTTTLVVVTQLAWRHVPTVRFILTQSPTKRSNATTAITVWKMAWNQPVQTLVLQMQFILVISTMRTRKYPGQSKRQKSPTSEPRNSDPSRERNRECGLPEMLLLK